MKSPVGGGCIFLIIRRLYGVLPCVRAVSVVDAGAALHGVACGGELRGYVNLGVDRRVDVVVVLVVVGIDAAILSMAAGDGQRAVALELKSWGRWVTPVRINGIIGRFVVVISVVGIGVSDTVVQERHPFVKPSSQWGGTAE